MSGSNKLVDALYVRIASENDPAKLQKVLLSSSYPSLISLKLQGIKEMLKDNKGRMDIDSINFAIRKLRREETIDRSPTDSESMIRKYYFSADFARLASEEDGLLDLETCVRNDFVYHHHNAFGQDSDLFGHQSKKEVICIPVVHHGSWSLYAFDISDKKLSIFDPAPERAFKMSYQKLGAVDPTSVTDCRLGRRLVSRLETEHENSRLKICKALDFVKDNFNLFKNVSGKFSSWRYEFTDLGPFRKRSSSLPATPLRICSDEDSGFFVFNFMRRWDGQRFIQPAKIPKEPEKLRKDFLEYIVSFNCNEVYERDGLPDVFDPMEMLRRHAQGVSGRPAWTRCKMDTGLLKAVRENNTHDFAGLFEVLKDDYPKRKMLRQNLRRGATSDGDGMLHIAARYGDLELLRAIFNEVHVKLDLKEVKSRMLELGSRTRALDACVQVVLPTTEVAEVERPQRLVELQGMLRSRNHKGETCLHEAVRHGDELFALSLILADEKIMKDVVFKANGQQLPMIFYDGGRIKIKDVIKINGPLLVQIVDYEGVSPLYLATTLCRSNIVKIILKYQLAAISSSGGPTGTGTPGGSTAREFNQIVASFSGPGGKTALHAAVVLNEELTEQILNWMKDVNDVPDLTVMSDSSGNTPLHLVSSVDDGAAIAKLLLSVTTKAASGSGTVRNAALKKDSKGWLPIHVAATNGNLGVIKQLIDKCPECAESRNTWGESFLHVAVESKRRNVVRYVCSQQRLAGILNLTDLDGNTALHLAVESGSQFQFCDLMANPRVCLSSANREGRTPLDVAKLSIGPGIRLKLSSRILIHKHLKRSGAHYGTCRRDVLEDEIAGKHDKDKVSETITKSAGLIAVCAIFILNLSVTAFFNVVKQTLAPTLDPNTTAAAPPSHVPAPLAASTAEGSRSARLRVHAFKSLMAADAITFSFSFLAAFCSTFAGFSIMDHPTRFMYLNIALFCVQVSCMGLIAIFILAAYLAFSPVDPHITILACVLPIAVLIPQLVISYTLHLLHAWTLYCRWFQKHISPKIQTYFPAKKFTTITKYSTKIKGKMEPIWTWFLTKIVRPTLISCRYCFFLAESCRYCILLVFGVVGVVLISISLRHLFRHQ